MTGAMEKDLYPLSEMRFYPAEFQHVKTGEQLNGDCLIGDKVLGKGTPEEIKLVACVGMAISLIRKEK